MTVFTNIIFNPFIRLQIFKYSPTYGIEKVKLRQFGGNRLQSVNDATWNSSGYDDNDGTYIYDDNGNLRYDPSKGTNIYYNYLNLPEQVQFGADDNLRYAYDAARLA